MQTRRLLLLALMMVVAGPLPARADDPPAKDVATIGDCLRKQAQKKGGSSQAKLREMQRLWIHTRDLTSAFWYDYFQGTMANPMIAYCNNRETARRAIYLKVFATDIADRK